MREFFALICGLLSGVLGGMGMGGGTLLIPALVIFFNVSSHSAAAINLISFIPTATISLIVHVKNGLVKRQGLFWIVFPAILSGVGAFYISRLTDGAVLTKIFGGFLILLAIFSLFSLKKEKNGARRHGADCVPLRRPDAENKNS